MGIVTTFVHKTAPIFTIDKRVLSVVMGVHGPTLSDYSNNHTQIQDGGQVKNHQICRVCHRYGSLSGLGGCRKMLKVVIRLVENGDIRV